MNNRFTLITCLIAGILFTLTVTLPTVYAEPGTSLPFQMLQDQINELADAVSQSDKSVTVDCSPTDKISDALTNAPPGGRYIITVEGICVENVTITRDDVTVQGGSGVVDGRITIDGARRVVIDGLTVTGPLHGILALSNATVTVQNSIIEDNGLSGIAVRFGAFALIDNNTIRNNGECEIMASDSGQVNMLNNEIVSNLPGDSCAAVGCFRDARIRMRGGNKVTQNEPSGLAVFVAHGSTFRQDGGHDTVEGNVQVINMSNAEFRDVDITGNIDLLQIAVLRMRNPRTDPQNVTVTGDININLPNLARFSNPLAVIDGNINCNGGLLFGFPILRNSPPNAINCLTPPLPPPLPAP